MTALASARIRAANLGVAALITTLFAISSTPVLAQAATAPAKIDAILDLLRPLGLKELVRTGAVAIGRGAKGWKG